MTIALAANAAPLNKLDTALAKAGAAVARGEQDKLAAAFTEAFEAGLTLDQAKEVVGQLYAYCGFPRALNAAATLQRMENGKWRMENSGATPETRNATSETPFTLGEKALEIGTANQTKLCAGVKHWHGAAPDSWFQHIALEVPGTEPRNEWLEPVDDAAYAKATK